MYLRLGAGDDRHALIEAVGIDPVQDEGIGREGEG